MLAAQRRVEILQAVEAAGTLTTDELAQRLRVSGETIRRDLLLLDRERLVRRVHGGAMATPQMRREEPPYSVRAADSAAKHRIGQLAASLVNPGRTVVFDVGTTVLAAARALPANFSGVAVTCSCPSRPPSLPPAQKSKCSSPADAYAPGTSPSPTHTPSPSLRRFTPMSRSWGRDRCRRTRA